MILEADRVKDLHQNYYFTKRKKKQAKTFMSNHPSFSLPFKNTSPVLSNIRIGYVYKRDPDCHIDWAVTRFYNLYLQSCLSLIEVTCNLLGSKCEPCKAQELCPQRGLDTMTLCTI